MLGKGGDSVARMLNDRSVPPPRGTTWNAAAIRRIVHHRAYLGEMTRRMQAEVFTFTVPAIVPPGLWALANATIDGNRKTAARNAKHAYLLSSTKDAPVLCWPIPLLPPVTSAVCPSSVSAACYFVPSSGW